MAFGEGCFVKVFDVEDKGNYSVVSIASSKRNKQTNEYETDFSSKFVRFIGDAHKCRPMYGQKIKLKRCAVENVYMKNGQKCYLKNPIYLVYSYELEDGSNSVASVPSVELQAPNFEELKMDDDLPF